MQKKPYFSVMRLSVIGLMAAMVFVTTMYLRIDIPTPLGKTMLHFGNVMCILSGLLFGGMTGGLAAGLGSAIFDLMDPTFAPEFWITFLMKFAMAFIAGMMMRRARREGGEPSRLSVSIAAVTAAVGYFVLYITKTILWNRFVLGAEWGAVWTTVATKATVSLVNAVAASIISVLLYFALRPALKAAGIFTKLGE